MFFFMLWSWSGLIDLHMLKVVASDDSAANSDRLT